MLFIFLALDELCGTTLLDDPTSQNSSLEISLAKKVIPIVCTDNLTGKYFEYFN